MTFFDSFAVSFGTLLVLMAVIAAWLFRTTPAPLWLKIVAPSIMTAVACHAPFAVNTMMGFPTSVRLDELPEKAELIAFVAHDEVARVDLWLRATDVPRAYETQLDDNLKKTLRDASEEIAHGRPAVLRKRAADSQPNSLFEKGFADRGQAPLYFLDRSAATALPPKH